MEPVSARLFHEQDWGGMIEASCVPKRRTYLDDRFELFGKQEILDYLRALEGGPGWDELEKRYQGFDLVWVRTDCGLAKRLTTDPQWKGADSTRFVREAKSIVMEMEAEIANIDVTIIAEKPRIAPHREAIAAKIASLLDLPHGHVNVKATTTDHLGFLGRGECICAMAVVLIETGEQSDHTPIEGVL